VHCSRVNKIKITKPIFIVTLHHVLPNSQDSTSAHPPSKYALFPMLYNDLDSSIGIFHTFPNFGNHHKFSFPFNGETMPPHDIRGQVNRLLPSYFHFDLIKI
jgi:hypothetical protein